ncbi:MAG: DUF115 domain-containing protein [Thalassotalea sp.]|nr:DUF115 domain-containing protein [Thalassotalea sp.]
MTSIEQQIELLEEQIGELEELKEREAVFAEIANSRFQRNIEALNKYYPDVADAMVTYQASPDFCLHVTKSGAANIFPNGGEVALYGDDPVQQAKEQVERNIENPFLTYTNYGSISENDERIHIQYMNKVASLVNEFQSNDYSVIQQLPESFPTLMNFGVGLGYHIPELLGRSKFKYVFIIEPEIELFFGSLFCIDWAELIETLDEQGANLFLSIGVSYQDFFSDISNFSEKVGAFSLTRAFCYQHYPTEELNSLIESFKTKYFEFQVGFGFYNDALTGMAHQLRLLEKNTFLYDRNVQHIDTASIPAVVIGNGPSLDHSIEFLKQHSDDLVIFACGTALGSLLKNGITPDFHVIVERPLSQYEVLRKVLPVETYKELNLLSLNMLYPDIVDMYKWSGLAVKASEAGSDLLGIATYSQKGNFYTSIPYTNPLVSNTGAAFAASLGFNEVYFIGIDNGYADNGLHHSKHSFYHKPGHEELNPYKNTNRILKGNFGGDVRSTDILSVSKTQLDKLVQKYRDITFYNVGDGAYIEGAIPLREQDMFVDKYQGNKLELVESIKTTQFAAPEVEDIDSYVHVDKFAEICQHMLDISSREANTRDEALDILSRQSRYVYSLKGTALSHFFHMLKGSLLYVHCPLVTMLYSYEEDEETMNYFKKGLAIWDDYILSIQKDFEVNWKKPCDMGLIWIDE